MNITDYMVNAGIKRKRKRKIAITNFPNLKEYSNKLCTESNYKTIPIHKKYRDIKNNEYQVF